MNCFSSLLIFILVLLAERMKFLKKPLILIIMVFLFCVPLLTPVSMNSTSTTVVNELETQNSKPLDIFQEASDVGRAIRVALYDETNLTQPAYASIGNYKGNVTSIEAVLVDAGYEVTRVTEVDIEGSDLLRTGLFDVFVMDDNNPRPSMVDEIINFWKGGGGILSIDGAINFLCYYGVLIPLSTGDNGYSTYWNYDWSQNQTVLNRHPVSQEYSVGQEITNELDWATVNMTSVSGHSYFGEYTVITHAASGTTSANTVVRDPLTQGRIVQTFGWNTEEPPHGPMIVDAVDWLCPRPKARVVFDFTHFPYYGIDEGDPSGFHTSDRFAELRDALVERTYTVDKLLPSAEGNLTYENLAPYDVLIINTPEWNFTAAEVAAVQNWVADGGGLILFGDWTSAFLLHNQNMNYLLSPFDLSLSEDDYTPFAYETSDSEMHPTTEYVTTIHYDGGVYVNVTGAAYPLWYNGSNIVSAAQEYGMGRVFLAGDINFLSNYIGSNDNMQYGVNLVNWISSGPAGILLYTDEPDSVNYHQTPVARALNELGVDYFLTVSQPYVNLSLHLKDWELLIVDNPWWGLSPYYEAFANHILDNGKFLMSGYQIDSYADDPLWPLLGFEFAAETLGNVELHIWEPGAPVFNQPCDYGALNFTPSRDYGDEGDLVTVFDNATALAGWSTTPQDGNASIVLRDDAMTLYNAYLIDEFNGDIDDSTYADNYELWLNEIAFLLKVSIDHPGNVVFTEGETGNNIVWHPHSLMPAEYIIKMDGVTVEQEPGFGGEIVYGLDGLDNGTYIFTITVIDRAGYTAFDEVEVTVEQVVPTEPTTTTTPTTPPGPIDPTMLIIIVAAAGGVIIIIIILMMVKKKKG